MNPLKQSIRRQLLVWLLTPLTCLWVVFGVLTYFLAIELTRNAYDRTLADSARYVATRLRFQSGKVGLDFPPAAEAVFRDDPKDTVYYQVIGPDGQLVAGDQAMPRATPDETLREMRFRTDAVAKAQVRIASVTWPVPDSPDERVVIQVAETLHERNQLETRILITILIPEILTVALAATAILFGVRQGLAPLKLVQEAVASRSPSDLRPLPEDQAPKEVRPLVRAINDLLRRLEKDIEAQRRFVANAAHQLRTPLAGLKTQTQLALRQPNLNEVPPLLRKIQGSADRCARLVHQLLVLAKVEPGAIDNANYTPVDLNAIARNAAEEAVSDAVNKGIDLGFEGASEPVFVRGVALTLHELIFNLVENAVRYTQPGGHVTVRVTAGDGAQLSVEDNGPGIPAEERERVFERFYRILGTGVTGSGLGLAIVNEIATAHGAEVALSAGASGGTLVAVSFPPTKQAPAVPALAGKAHQSP